jgi:plasmid stabilization system protein ParE
MANVEKLSIPLSPRNDGPLAENPRLDRARPDTSQALHCFPAGSYLILDRPLHAGIEVVRVVHGPRRLERLM